jgi:hypothetical protein
VDPTILDTLDQGFSGHHPLVGCDLQDLSQRVELDAGDVIQLAYKILDLARTLGADIISYVEHEDVHLTRSTSSFVLVSK